MSTAIYTVILQDPETGQIGSVINYTDEALAVMDFYEARRLEEDVEVHLFYCEAPGERTIKLVPAGRPQGGKTWLLH